MEGQMEVNFFGTVAVTKEVLPFMREQGRGKIVLISSISGRVGFPGLGPYAASKFALEGFAESLRHEASPLGIDIILIEPGPFQTGIWEKSISSAQDRIAHSCLKKETARLEKEIRKSAASAGNPMDVIEILLQSLRAKHPKLRYTAGKGIRPTLAAKAFFPWRRSFEKIVQRMLSKD
ncbi:SDR family NAD(P)-dependent oxidoreductase [Paenibacillus larvae]|uniref:SDR family NAD(P)-dependent oxidoreductase n=1 Tax=Paenibacillus larvae TaxID=1464 RepID=UPI0028906B85|nr:SDR family NAD(P)-dependent oxidoreductase [Paenibacillus larvae]MDT2193023.1 SDR family NAD(P)-dependent oxidoreductase [Paenibacillus larvae]